MEYTTKLLIADENPSFRASLKDSLVRMGYRNIEEAANGEEALLKMEDAVDPETARKELKALCDYANINYHTTMLKAKIYAKRWW